MNIKTWFRSMKFKSRFGLAFAFLLAAGCICGFQQKHNEVSVSSSGKDYTFKLPGNIQLEMVRVEPGTFTMGIRDSESFDNEKEHSVTLKNAFWIGKTEVTQAQWKAVMGSNPAHFPPLWKMWTSPDLPVENVTWDDCKAFCKKLNELYAGKLPSGYQFDFPTEAQWEYAARGGNKSKGYKYSGSDGIDKVAWYDENSGNETHPVGKKAPNELGLYDMTGNVREWCRDYFEKDYAGDPDFLSGNEGLYRVTRGGSSCLNAKKCRSSGRNSQDTLYRRYDLGLRLALVRVQSMTASQQKVVKKDKSEVLAKREVKSVAKPEAKSVSKPEIDEKARQKQGEMERIRKELEHQKAEIERLKKEREAAAQAKREAVAQAKREADEKANQKQGEMERIRKEFEQQKAEIERLKKEREAEKTQMERLKKEAEEAKRRAEVPTKRVVSQSSSVNNFTFTLSGNIPLEMERLEPGTFTMGKQDRESDLNEKEHSVTLKNAFWIGKIEVTQAQWKSIMGNNPSNFKGDNLPVENVSWADCKNFCEKLNKLYAGKLPEGYRFDLPTEAQWEYAARGGNKSRGYKYSGGNDIGDIAWYDGNSGSKTHPAGLKAPNELGLYDMSGNVWEWCRDWYERGYASDPELLNGNNGSYRVCRGGSWTYRARNCRSSDRDSHDLSYRRYDLGFRIALVRVQ